MLHDPVPKFVFQSLQKISLMMVHDGMHRCAMEGKEQLVNLMKCVQG